VRIGRSSDRIRATLSRITTQWTRTPFRMQVIDAQRHRIAGWSDRIRATVSRITRQWTRTSSGWQRIAPG